MNLSQLQKIKMGRVRIATKVIILCAVTAFLRGGGFFFKKLMFLIGLSLFRGVLLLAAKSA
ncbi:MAG: hypothetical protein CMD92_07270 [Gammaproteobacteria bacterium]|nr:hypothetical protein [Gammaproteobacteria bacterium]